MQIQKEKVISLLQDFISVKKTNDSIVFIDYLILKKGSVKNIGKSRFTLPFDGYMVFIDLEPKINWTHKCLYLFIKTDFSEIKKRTEYLPPYYAEYPDTYFVLLRYGRIPKDDRNFNPFNH